MVKYTAKDVINLKKLIVYKIKSAFQYVKTFFKWAFIASITGIIGGGIGTAFSICIKSANQLEGSLWYLVLFMPLAGVIIVFLYNLLKVENDLGTN